MSIVQGFTWLLVIITLALISWVIRNRRRYTGPAAWKSVILLTVVVHFAVFYSAVFAVDNLHNMALYEWLMRVFHTDFPFGEWSAALRLHTIIAILNKEIVSIMADRIRKNGFSEH